MPGRQSGTLAVAGRVTGDDALCGGHSAPRGGTCVSSIQPYHPTIITSVNFLSKLNRESGFMPTWDDMNRRPSVRML